MIPDPAGAVQCEARVITAGLTEVRCERFGRRPHYFHRAGKLRWQGTPRIVRTLTDDEKTQT